MTLVGKEETIRKFMDGKGNFKEVQPLGRIDNVKVFDRALSKEEVVKQYESQFVK